MDDIVIEQALFRRPDRDSPQLTAASPDFHQEWLLEAEGLILGFGDRPLGVRCPHAIFAYPIGADGVAIVRVIDRVTGNPEKLGADFLVQVIARKEYSQFFGDPFELASRLPETWQPHAGMSACRIPAEPLPPRTVEQVRQVLRRVKGRPLAEDAAEGTTVSIEDSESPALLGGVQVLVDGGQLVFERATADSGLIPALWMLLPYSTRENLWPASFAFGNDLGFDALVVPRAVGAEYNGYTSEEQAAEYPEGRYELNLQIAAEAGDQRQLDVLFQRRSWLETWRLGVTLLVAFVLLALASRILL